MALSAGISSKAQSLDFGNQTRGPVSRQWGYRAGYPLTQPGSPTRHHVVFFFSLFTHGRLLSWPESTSDRLAWSVNIHDGSDPDQFPKKMGKNKKKSIYSQEVYNSEVETKNTLTLGLEERDGIIILYTHRRAFWSVSFSSMSEIIFRMASKTCP